ncbi:MAG: DUF192 domain-containing protein [Thermoplasmata archaeon]
MTTKDQRKNMAIVLAIVIVIMVAVWLVLGNTNDVSDIKEANIMIKNSDGEEYELTVEIADDDEERSKGLMNRDSLCENCGMLFVYEEDVYNSFWMKDTKIPLSIAFIAENGTINEIQQMEPHTTDSHLPEDVYRYALEVNQGYFEENNIDAGDTVEIPEKIKT